MPNRALNTSNYPKPIPKTSACFPFPGSWKINAFFYNIYKILTRNINAIIRPDGFRTKTGCMQIFPDYAHGIWGKIVCSITTTQHNNLWGIFSAMMFKVFWPTSMAVQSHAKYPSMTNPGLSNIRKIGANPVPIGAWNYEGVMVCDGLFSNIQYIKKSTTYYSQTPRK